jgi:hypothetical protein
MLGARAPLRSVNHAFVGAGMPTHARSRITLNTALDACRRREADGKKSKLSVVDVYTDQGRRPQMEDKHVVFEDLNPLLESGGDGLPWQAFFGVYDGHGGVEAASFAAMQLHHFVASHPSFGEDVSRGSNPCRPLALGFSRVTRLACANTLLLFSLPTHWRLTAPMRITLCMHVNTQRPSVVPTLWRINMLLAFGDADILHRHLHRLHFLCVWRAPAERKPPARLSGN